MTTPTLFRRCSSLAAVVLAAGCTAGQSSLAELSPTPHSTYNRVAGANSTVLAHEEIRSVEVGPSALELLRRLRPEFLTTHGIPNPRDAAETYAMVYLDGIRLGGLETLQDIPVSTILEIRYLRSTAAAELVGKNFRGGVIAVQTIR